MKNRKIVLLSLAILLFMTISFVAGFMFSEFLNPTVSPSPSSILREVMRTVRAPNAQVDVGAGKYDLLSFEPLYEAVDKVKEYYVEEIKDTRKLVYGAIEGMLKSLNDPYTRFMTPETFGHFMEETKGHFDGIGAILGMRLLCPFCHGKVKAEDTKCPTCGAKLRIKLTKIVILEPLKGNPAYKAGLKAGDEILRIDGVPTVDMDVEDAANRIKGRAGTKVRLTVQRKVKGKTETLEFTITRSKIEPFPVEYQVLKKDKDIGYIKLSAFNEKAEEELDDALNELHKKRIKGLILDLRRNPGGLLDVAVSVTSRFVPEGAIVYVEERGKPREAKNAIPGKHALWTGPLVVLVDEYSASGSEILAGAIKDRKLGKLVGVTTFGKGMVQGVFKLSDGSAISLSTARYLTPNGIDINKKGIEPDFVVERGEMEPGAEPTQDPQLDKAIAVIKKEIAERSKGVLRR